MQVEAMHVDRESPPVQRSGKLRFAVLLLGVAALAYVCTHSSVFSTNAIGGSIKPYETKPFDLPLNLKASAQPVIKVRKKVDAGDNAVKVGVDYDVSENSFDLEASTDASTLLSKLVGEDYANDIGGEVALNIEEVGKGDFAPKVEFRRKWFAPGIAGFKTKVELKGCYDLSSMTPDARVTFGLRNKEKNTVELERTVVGEEIGVDERVKMDLGASLNFPDKLELSMDDVKNVRKKLDAANLEIDFDKIALCIDLE